MSIYRSKQGENGYSGGKTYKINYRKDDYYYVVGCFRECWYDINEMGTEINTMCGITFGLNDENNIRIGWRPSLKQGKFDYYASWRNNGNEMPPVWLHKGVYAGSLLRINMYASDEKEWQIQSFNGAEQEIQRGIIFNEYLPEFHKQLNPHFNSGISHNEHELIIERQ